MNGCPRSPVAHGFTLVEVVLSLGILALSITVIMGSLGASGRLAANDARRATAVDLLEKCFRDAGGVMRPAGTPSPMLGIEPLVWDAKPAKRSLWFNAEGERVEKEEESFFRCELTSIRPNNVRVGHLHGRVVWPARRRGVSPDGEVEMFTSLFLP
jgi:hypothetical protein